MGPELWTQLPGSHGLKVAQDPQFFSTLISLGPKLPLAVRKLEIGESSSFQALSDFINECFWNTHVSFNEGNCADWELVITSVVTICFKSYSEKCLRHLGSVLGTGQIKEAGTYYLARLSIPIKLHRVKIWTIITIITLVGFVETSSTVVCKPRWQVWLWGDVEKKKTSITIVLNAHCRIFYILLALGDCQPRHIDCDLSISGT